MDNCSMCESSTATAAKFEEPIITSSLLPKFVITDDEDKHVVAMATAATTSPRRSCDSAYGSSMESNLPQVADDEPTFSDEQNATEQKGAQWLEPASKKNSCCSSLCSEPEQQQNSNEQLPPPLPPHGKNNLVLDRQAFLRKLSSASKYSLRSSLSIESEDDLMSGSDDAGKSKNNSTSPAKRGSSWTKLRRMVIWSPFMQSFKKNYPWVQLAGHTGNFQPGEEGCILKKYVKGEADFLKLMSESDEVRGLAPEYHGVVDDAGTGQRYTRMQDLLMSFDQPSIMDCKMGVRTYLEEELTKARKNPSLRPDMYKKMVEISPDAPTHAEHEQKAVTKPRYMQWREVVSSTSNLGFRIEGIKKANKEPSKDYKLTKTEQQVVSAFRYFIDGNLQVLDKYIERLECMRDKLKQSQLFTQHEVIGSSLLFVHDESSHASTWMIDFGKTTKLPQGVANDHTTEWVEGNREDGYLFGMQNLILLFKQLRADLMSQDQITRL